MAPEHVAHVAGAGSVSQFLQLPRDPFVTPAIVFFGEADNQSDVDVLVDLDPGRSLLDLGGLQFELEALLGCPVDVVTERGLKPRIRERVPREAVPV